jgi:hypothetical protein
MTLGYGDIVMSGDWRLLGPQEAVATLAFGWSTAALVATVMRLIRCRPERDQALGVA